MPIVSNVKLHMDLVADLQSKGKTYLESGQDMMRKANNMLAYAQAHCEHEWIPAHPANAHEGGVCKHCTVNELHAAQHRKQWLALEDAGIAPWGPRATTRPVKTKSLVDLPSDGAKFQRTDQ